MNKQYTSPNYIKILNVLYIIISLVVMGIFFIASIPRIDEYFGINAVARLGAMLAVLIVVALAIGVALRAKK